MQVNATGVMPVIFASSLLAAPQALVRFINTAPMIDFARAVAPTGPLYLPVRHSPVSSYPILSDRTGHFSPVWVEDRMPLPCGAPLGGHWPRPQ